MFKIKRSAELKTAAWAGGTTTQLFINPATAEYQKFNFDYRFSYATVEVEESTFTFMPGVTRHLLILEGQLYIEHIDRYQKLLKKFDIDTFDGEWPTKAKGRVKDFNLMTRGRYHGKLSPLILAGSESQKLELSGIFNGFFIQSGSVTIILNGEKKTLEQGDFAEIESGSGGCRIEALARSEVIWGSVEIIPGT